MKLETGLRWSVAGCESSRTHLGLAVSCSRKHPKAACGVEAGWSLLEMLLLLATVPLLYFLPRLCARPQAPETLHAAFQGVGAGPIFSGDPFAGPNAVPALESIDDRNAN